MKTTAKTLAGKYRTVYAANSRGRYIARERLYRAGPSAHCWVEQSRVYEDEMLTAYPTESMAAGIGPECAAKGGS